MKRPTKIDAVRDEFIDEITCAVDLVADVVSALRKVSESDLIMSPQLRMEQIHEFAFLKLIASWEVFLERTLVLYLMGKKTGSGYQPIVKVKNIKDEEIAYALLSGKMPYDVEKHYLRNLSNPVEIKNIANRLFDTHCYDFENPNSRRKNRNVDLFGYVRHIRNHIAHSSRSSEAKFKSTVNYFVGKKHNFSAGKFLMHPVKRKMQFGNYFVSKELSYFGAYCLFFSSLAARIAPYK